MIKRYIYSKKIKQEGSWRIRRWTCHSVVGVGNIAEEFTSLLEKFLLLEVSHIFQSTDLDVTDYHSAVIVVVMRTAENSIA